LLVLNCSASPHVLASPNRPSIDSGSGSHGSQTLTGISVKRNSRAIAGRVLSIVTIPSDVSTASTARPFQPFRIHSRSLDARPRPPAVLCDQRRSLGFIRTNRGTPLLVAFPPIGHRSGSPRLPGNRRGVGQNPPGCGMTAGTPVPVSMNPGGGGVTAGTPVPVSMNPGSVPGLGGIGDDSGAGGSGGASPPGSLG